MHLPKLAEASFLKYIYQAQLRMIITNQQGEVEMMTPVAAQMLMPLTRTGRLDNVFEVLQPYVPQLAKFIDQATNDIVCDGLEFEVPWHPEPRVMSLNLHRLGPDKFLATLADVTRKAHQYKLALVLKNQMLRTAQAAVKAQAARYTDFYDFSPTGFVSLTRDGTITQINLAGAKLVGTERATLKGARFDGFVVASDRPDFEPFLQQVFAAGATQTCEVGLLPADGAEAEGQKGQVPRIVQIAATLSADGQECRAVLVDITERKAFEITLLAAKADAEQANNAKSRFLAAASHDLRQPLAALSLYVDVLKSEILPADDKILTNMVTCITSLSALLGDLLDISKLEAGVVAPEICDFSVSDLLSGLFAVHAPPAQEKGLRLRCRPSGMRARTDPVLFARMLGNLIANAIRYTNRGGVLIACRRHQGRTWVEIWDSGIGIAPGKTQEIFEEYRQLAPNNSSRGGGSVGSGLGLAIVAKMAALMGLGIRVKSRPGKGSLFAVELPLSADTAAGRDAAMTRPLRIALVDDDVISLTTLRGALEGKGHRVVSARSGVELLRQLGSGAPDVVVANYCLPDGETGFNVIEAVRMVFGERLTALLITGDTSPDLRRRMSAKGIDVQQKPLNSDTLLAAIAHQSHGQFTTEKFSNDSAHRNGAAQNCQ